MPKCSISGEQFTISEDDVQFYRKLDVPPPTLAPIERMRRRLAFRHGGKLHHVTCGLTGKKIISMYAPSSAFPIYEQNAWWSDVWSGFSFGRDFDFSRPFYPQLAALSAEVPHISLVSTNCENSYYTNHALNLKNCYLLFGATNDEDCLYGYFIISCKDVLDSISMLSCELCYDGVACFDCYNCVSLTNSKNCVDCFLIEDCQSCESCLACFGLQRKKYYVLNEPVGKDKFLALKSQMETSNFAEFPGWQTRFEQLRRSRPRVYAHLYNCEDCTGDMLFHSKECHACFDLRESEHCKFIAFSPNSVHSYDCNMTAPDGVQFCYESVSTLGKDLKFNAIVWFGNEIDYSMECHHSKNLFGCIGLKKAQYCILNKQYTANEYKSLRAKIIGKMKETREWGEFFPVSMSPYPYNDSMAQHYFPLSKEAANQHGYRWRDDSAAEGSPSSFVQGTPSLQQPDQTLLDAVFRCAASGKTFKITPSELNFYRKLFLPLPQLASEERSRRRFLRRAPYRLFQRKCAKCGLELASVYSQKEAEKVLCEKDFLELAT